MVLTIEERQDLRKEILKDLYDYHFENNGRKKDAAQEASSHETNLAYEYLSGKGYIEYNVRNNGLFADAKVTSYGIDIVEQNEEL